MKIFLYIIFYFCNNNYMKKVYIHSEVYNELSCQWKSMSTNAFKVEIFKCTLITDICTGIINGNIDPNSFYIDTDKYVTLLNDLNVKQTNKYRLFLRIINELTEYFCCKSLGYCYYGINSYSYSLYYITDKLHLIIDKIILYNRQYYLYDIGTIKTGCNVKYAYKYNGKTYNSYHDITKDSKIKFGEYNKVLNKVKQSTIKTSLLETGLDDVLIETISSNEYNKKYFNENNIDTCLTHVAKLSIKDLHIIKEYEKEKGNDKNVLHIINKILCNITTDGYYVQNYYRGSHGRLYQHGLSMQLLNSEYRNLILSDYKDVDIKAATFSILWNYARESGIKDDNMKVLYEYTYDPDGFRTSILKKLQDFDSGVTLKYVKDVLNAIAFGAKIDEHRVYADIMNGTYYSIPVATKGYIKRETPLNIVGLDEVKELAETVKYITKKLVEKNKKGNTLINCIGLKQELKPRMQYGKKLSHLYQGAEVRVLETILGYPIDGKKLIDIPYSIGLLLHDGIYIRKNIFKEINNILPLSEYIEKKLGYVLNFS